MGACQEMWEYRVEAQKEIPGTQNFATVHNFGQTQNADHSWQQTTLNLSELCRNNPETRIKFVCKREGDNFEFNSCVTSVNALNRGFPITLNGNLSATYTFENVSVFTRPTFLDYLRSGWQISLVAAIDYTASNRDPSTPQSLHYQGDTPNQYEVALTNVGAILEPYDNDMAFPVFGFGGIPRHMNINAVSHCFALNGDPANPNIIGIQNIVSMYKQSLSQVGLGGPTLFAPLLLEFKKYVQSVMAMRTYPVLLLLTDGAIHDMPQTKDLVYDLSQMPCSIIIIGVGNADFSSMEELDGDGGRLRDSRGRPCQRDIVQFVIFNQAM